MYCINYNYNKKFELFKFQEGFITFHVNSPQGYSPQIISGQTAIGTCLQVV